MDQTWMYWNYDLGEHLYVNMGKLGEFLKRDYPRELAWRVVRAVALVNPYPPSDTDTSQLAVHRPESNFDILPNEMIDQIFRELDKLEDVLCLCVTSQRCWNIGRACLEAGLQGLVQGHSWACDRIMCKGESFDYLKDALPDGMLSAEEEDSDKQFSKWYVKTADRTYFWWHEYNKHPDFTKKFSKQELALLYRLIAVWPDETVPKYSAPPLEETILRNFTRREYVRGEAIRELADSNPESLWLSNLTFGEVVTTRICWSPNPSVAMTNTGNIHRGVWAGHRIDILWIGFWDPTPMGRLPWKDVSDEVVQEITNIGKANFV